MDKQLDVKTSKCFTCMFGICVKQKETSHVIPSLENETDEPIEPWKSETMEKDSPSINHSGIVSVCFWPKIYLREDVPLQMGYVEECNRYRLQNSDEKPLAKPKK